VAAGPHRHLLVHGHSPVHVLPPEVKIAATFLFVVGVSITPREALWAFVIDGSIVAVLLAVAGYRVRQVLARMTIVLPFLIVALIVPFVSSGEPVEVGWFTVSREGLWAAWNIVAKTSIGFCASLLLAGTTPISEVVRGLGRLKLPSLVVSIVAFMFRYLDLIVEEMGRIRTAMVARAHDPRWLWQAKPIASAAGAMFVRSYERGERVHAAMLARGFDGTMPQLDHRAAVAREWVLAMLLPSVSITLAILAFVR